MSSETCLKDKVQACAQVVAAHYGGCPEQVPNDLRPLLGKGWTPVSALQFLAGRKFRAKTVSEGAEPEWYEIHRAANALYYLDYKVGREEEDIIADVALLLAQRIGTLIGQESTK
ncbi:hypothetical protein NRA16_17760 [Acinetobacter baumannii]|nr:hypothetical protein [Acinetobacter baumannii]